MDIKPIETRYKGYRFRSRLEARWAVFFDALNVPWEYEREGFELGEGRKYLPDFYLPDQRAIVEVKHRDFGNDPQEYARAMLNLAQLCVVPGSHMIHQTTILCAGNPYPGEYDLSVAAAGRPIDAIHGGVWGLDRKDPRSLWVVNDKTGEATQLNPASPDHDKYPLSSCGPLDAAYSAARSARFEHGESGAPS